MKELYELKEKLCDELKEYGKKDMTAGSLDVIDKLAHSIKNIDKIINEGDYSNGMPYYARANRRDARGRYTSHGYSYDDMMISKLHDLMEEAPDDKTRQEFKRFISKMENM